MNVDLVLEGGGVKGIALVGAYRSLSEAGFEPHAVAGASAGAIVGALIAAGVSPNDLDKLIRQVDYRAFEDKGFLDHLGLVGQGLSLLLEKGIYEGRYLHQWLDGILTGLGKRTFGDLRLDDPDSSLPPERRYRLVVMVSDISCGRLARLPWDYPKYGKDPDAQLVADAVRASMSIPFFYEPVRWKTHNEKGEPLDAWLVDGGMLSNFPVDIFDRTDGKRSRWPTFGVKLSARPDSALRQRFEIHGGLGFAKALAGTMSSFHDQIHIEDPSVTSRTIFVDTTGVKATDFDLDEETQNRLYSNGVVAATDFLKTWSFDPYVHAHSGRH